MSDIEKAINFYRDTSDDYAEALAQREYLKEFRKSKKAMLMNQAESKGITAANKQEVYAYSHKEYIELIEGLKVAIYEEARLRHLTTAAKLKIEVWRTQQASMRNEKKMYGA